MLWFPTQVSCQSSLCRRLRSHTGEKSFGCSQCEKIFVMHKMFSHTEDNQKILQGTFVFHNYCGGLGGANATVSSLFYC